MSNVMERREVLAQNLKNLNDNTDLLHIMIHAVFGLSNRKILPQVNILRKESESIFLAMFKIRQR